ncbi:MAG: YdbL family protein [Gammaproteobacteria bacterium]|jgi:uncharacterized protein YdbL (DUF1318 family)|nr:YdbL family protein [Gammaproteobacteria bacterium]
MNNRILSVIAVAALLLAACVTINVYFPEAAAREAATEFISGVLNDSAATEAGSSNGDGNGNGSGNGSVQLQPKARPQHEPLWLAMLNLLVPAAQAQQAINIDINTPAIQAIQQRMRERQQNVLKAYYEAGAIGLDNDGLVQIRDRTAVSLSERTQLQQGVNEDNQDRKAVYREIAVANDHPEWEDEIRSIFAERWIAMAPKGWYYQTKNGNWQQK